MIRIRYLRSLSQTMGFGEHLDVDTWWYNEHRKLSSFFYLGESFGRNPATANTRDLVISSTEISEWTMTWELWCKNCEDIMVSDFPSGSGVPYCFKKEQIRVWVKYFEYCNTWHFGNHSAHMISLQKPFEQIYEVFPFFFERTTDL